MDPLDHKLSLFSHSTDRGTAVAYFLGAVVPLVVLGAVTERFVLGPGNVTAGRFMAMGPAGVVGLFVAISTLSSIVV